MNATESTDESLYSPLDFTTFEFRTLKLESSEPSEEATYLLEHSSLIEPPEYYALSYEWGGTHLTKSICVNGRSVNVTANLKAALDVLKSKGYKRIWVDAVCINQKDFLERSLQVLRMGHIYSKAKEVIVWLGPQADQSDVALRYLADRTGNSKPTNEEDAAVMRLLKRSYWDRIWIIQEVSKAAEAIVFCGDSSVSWAQLSDFYALGANWFIPTASADQFSSVQSFRRRELELNRMSLLEALLKSRHSASTDPRDKVYALLGISADGSDVVLTPNYKQPVTEVFAQMTSAMLRRKTGLPCILLAPRTPSSSGDNDPTWFPRLKNLREPIPDWILSAVSQSKAPTSHVALKGPALEVYGTILDTIEDTDPCPSEDDNLEDGIIHGRASSLIFESSMPEKLPRKSSFNFSKHIAWRILSDICAALCGKQFSSLAESMEYVITFAFTANSRFWVYVNVLSTLRVQGRTIRDWMIDFQRPGYPSRRWERLTRRGVYHGSDTELPLAFLNAARRKMRLVRTSSDQFGMAYQEAMAGDQIWMLDGVACPVVLRKREEGGYYLVGEMSHVPFTSGMAQKQGEEVRGRKMSKKALQKVPKKIILY